MILLPYIVLIAGTFVLSAWRHWGWFGILAGFFAGLVFDFSFLTDWSEDASLLFAALVAASMGSRLPRLDGLFACAAGILIAVIIQFAPMGGGHSPFPFFIMASGVGFSLGGAVAAIIGYRRTTQPAGVA